MKLKSVELADMSSNYPELRAWLRSLPRDTPVDLPEILEEFHRRQPATPFVALCNIARIMLEAK